MNGLDQFKRAAAKVKARRETEALAKANVYSSVQLSVPNTIERVVKDVKMTDAEQAEADEQFRLKLQTTIIGHFKKLKGVNK
ncbi:hypothetical protein [Pseudomonas fluorescens]|uniref:hypothetical protein n=1 Tax=Pseudomonas fluorescens TaxID=294 RepID=UPI0011CE46E4|nr:hypothetical protein [Pseudomonas fluorescens]